MLLFVVEAFGGAVVRKDTKDSILEQPEPSIRSAGKARRRLDNLVEHGLQTLGSGDCPGDAADGVLMLLRRLELAREIVYVSHSRSSVWRGAGSPPSSSARSSPAVP